MQEIESLAKGNSVIQGLSNDSTRDRSEEVALGMEAKIESAEELSIEQRAALDVYEQAQSQMGAALDTSLRLEREQEQLANFKVNVRIHDDGTHQKILEHTSDVNRSEIVPQAPFFGSKVVRELFIDKIFEYINEVALIRGQWQFKRGKRSEDEYNRIMREEAYPALNELKLKCKRERLLHPALVYGYFPCKADGNDLVIYKSRNETSLHEPWQNVTPKNISPESVQEWLRYSFPRQHDGRHLCISDFFRPMGSTEFDVVAFHVVTVGKHASDYAHKLFEIGEFRDYLFFHGLSVECAEALAEYWHKIVRAELGIGVSDASDMRKLFAQGYQGSRYSFGYPACPNLEDQAKLFELLQPERIDVSLTEEFQLVPEQSTSAIICHHKEARYFNVR
jgi:5-methyltetrahydrofolate--homocysteine methyltransferase